MKIALIDLNHMTVGVHTDRAPLGIGLIAKYLKLQAGDSVDIRLFKEAEKFIIATETWIPDVLGMAQYSWNSELNLFIARRIKKQNPSLLVVAGGPNLELRAAEKEGYLKQNPVVDICVGYDGEIPFATIVQRFMAGEQIRSLRQTPIPGTYALDMDSGRLVESLERPPRLTSLDVFGAMYAEGFFDEFLNDGYQPFLQTQRGCPFLCAYCHNGNVYDNRILFQSKSNFRKDLEFLGKRYRNNHSVSLFLANANFGLFDQDFEIVDVIREIQEKYDWPKNIDTNSGKDSKKLLKLISRLKYKFTPAIALQTLTPKVLKNIRRVNIPFSSFVDFQMEVIRTIDSNTATELILSLPEETKTSFLDTIKQVLNSGVQNIVIFTLLSLRGTELATEESIKKYGHIFRYRIVPRCFSEIDGEKIFEIEKAVVGTNTMSHADYLELRGLALMITVFASSMEFMPLRRTLLAFGVDLAEWISEIQKTIVGYPTLARIFRQFISETECELYESIEALNDFFNQPKNFEDLKKGEYGDNLLRKYKAILLSDCFMECLDIAHELAVRLSKTAKYTLPLELLFDIKTYLKTRDIGNVFRSGYDSSNLMRATLHFDIPRWLEDSNERENLEKYHGEFVYDVTVTDYIQQRLTGFRLTNRDPQLSLQILYRDGTIRDFWPIWVPVTQFISK